MRTGSVLAGLAFLAGTAQAQSADTTARTDTSRVTRLQTITVTAERPRASAPPVTTIEVQAAELRRTFAADAYDLLRRTSGIEVHEQGQGPGLRLGRGHPRILLGPLVGCAAHARRRADQSAGARARRRLLRLEHPVARGRELVFGSSPGRRARSTGTSRSPAWSRSSPRPTPPAPPAASAGSSYGDAGGWLRSGGRSDAGGFLVAGDGPPAAGMAGQLGLLAGQRDAARLAARGLGPAGGRAWRSTARAGTRPGSSPWATSTRGVSPGPWTRPTAAPRIAASPTGGSPPWPVRPASTPTPWAAAGALGRLPDHPRGQRAQPERRGGPPHRPRRPVAGEPSGRRRRFQRGFRRPSRLCHATTSSHRRRARGWAPPWATTPATSAAARSCAGARSWARTWRSTSALGRTACTTARLDRLAGGDWRSATDVIASPKLGARYLAGRRLVAARVAEPGFPRRTRA